MIRRPPRSTRTDTLFPYTTLFRSGRACRFGARDAGGDRGARCPAQRPVRRLSRPERAVVSAWLLAALRSEEHTSELQSLMRISYAVFCLKTKKKSQPHDTRGSHKHHKSNTLHYTHQLTHTSRQR